MYVKKIQLINYGPIQKLDIQFPFENEQPKPVILVGENGAGKSAVISHIVNGMVLAKDEVYSKSLELEEGYVFKTRSPNYIHRNASYSFSLVNFESNLFVREMHLIKPKNLFTTPPLEASDPGYEAWTAKFDRDQDHFESNFKSSSNVVRALVSEKCLLYFPSNRMEEPAWLNKRNLKAKPAYTHAPKFSGETNRRIINYSPLIEIHDWLYDVAYDRAVLEMKTSRVMIPVNDELRANKSILNPVLLFDGYSGDATYTYSAALLVLKSIIPSLSEQKAIRFGIGDRHNRVLALASGTRNILPSVFQLSSGETALLTLFLSILKDFDLRKNREKENFDFGDISGLVVVDEIDLHLHSNYQYDILPKLVQMFPRVQFIFTTHSPCIYPRYGEVFRR